MLQKYEIVKNIVSFCLALLIFRFDFLSGEFVCVSAFLIRRDFSQLVTMYNVLYDTFCIKVYSSWCIFL